MIPIWLEKGDRSVGTTRSLWRKPLPQTWLASLRLWHSLIVTFRLKFIKFRRSNLIKKAIRRIRILFLPWNSPTGLFLLLKASASVQCASSSMLQWTHANEVCNHLLNANLKIGLTSMRLFSTLSKYAQMKGWCTRLIMKHKYHHGYVLFFG